MHPGDEQEGRNGVLRRRLKLSPVLKRKRGRSFRYASCKWDFSASRGVIGLLLVVVCGSLLSSNDFLVAQALPRSTTVDGINRRGSKPSFLSRLSAKVTFHWNGTIITGGGAVVDAVAGEESRENQEDETKETQQANDSSDASKSSLRARILVANRNSTLANALAEQLDSLPPSIKEFLQRNLYDDDKNLDEEEQEVQSIYSRLMTRSKNSTLLNTVTESFRSKLPSVKSFLQRSTADQDLKEGDNAQQKDDVSTRKSLLGARGWLATRNNSLAGALADQIRSIHPSVKDFLQRNNMENNRTSFDLVGAVSTLSHGCCSSSLMRSSKRPTTIRGGEDKAIPSVPSSSPATGLDRAAQGFCLNLGKIVALQCLATWIKSQERNWIPQLVDRILSEESAMAVKAIKAILTNMEDHGVVDVFSKFAPQEIAASVYTLYRLQRTAIRYEAIQERQEPHRHPEDLRHVLEDLSHYVVYATAAYGWKMDLAFQGKLHLGDEHALLRKTGILKEDIIKLNLKSKAHLPVYFLVRDRRRKALVLCIRGTWSAHDVLTDLCCTAEEYQGPVSASSSSSTAKAGGQRYCAHHGMLEAAMAVAIDMEDIIEEELEANPGYSLVLVGHSMGAGCCSLLATFWEQKFANMKAFLFGGPCVAPLDSHPTNNTAIINVVFEGDPFRCISLGHVADLSAAVGRLCEDPGLRRKVLTTTEGHVHALDVESLEFCFDTMEDLRNEVMTNADKMFPPGRIFHVTKEPTLAAPTQGISEYDSDTEEEPDFDSSPPNGVVIHEVGPDHFRELVIRPRMFDISRHLPSLYEDTLRSLISKENKGAASGR